MLRAWSLARARAHHWRAARSEAPWTRCSSPEPRAGSACAVAASAAARGYRVVVNYYSESEGPARDLVSRIEQANGGAAHALRCDAAREREVVAMFEEIDG